MSVDWEDEDVYDGHYTGWIVCSTPGEYTERYKKAATGIANTYFIPVSNIDGTEPDGTPTWMKTWLGRVRAVLKLEGADGMEGGALVIAIKGGREACHFERSHLQASLGPEGLPGLEEVRYVEMEPAAFEVAVVRRSRASMGRQNPFDD